MPVGMQSFLMKLDERETEFCMFFFTSVSIKYVYESRSQGMHFIEIHCNI